MRFLITNDDGILAEGLIALKAELEKLGEVTAIAPDRPRSAAGHAITLHKPLRFSPVRLRDGSLGYASNGTPSDCVVLGLSEYLGAKPDLVVAGINLGANLGEDLTYSGTVSAAMEAVILGLPAFAISLAADPTAMAIAGTHDYGPAARFAARLAQVVVKSRLPSDVILNVNVPPVPESETRPAAVTHQGRRYYESRLERRVDPRGRPYYWLGGQVRQAPEEEGSDVAAVADNRISVTPVHLDLTCYAFLEEMKGWEL